MQKNRVSMRSKRVILVGNLSEPGQISPDQVDRDLRRAIATLNVTMADALATPLSLGINQDFQGVAYSCRGALAVMFALEEHRLASALRFSLSYVLVEETPSAVYAGRRGAGRSGAGSAPGASTVARRLLSARKRDRPSYQIRLGDETVTADLCRILLALDEIVGRWTRDLPIIHAMISAEDDTVVARAVGLDRTSVLRRRRTAMVRSYQALKGAALSIAARHDTESAVREREWA